MNLVPAASGGVLQLAQLEKPEFQEVRTYLAQSNASSRMWKTAAVDSEMLKKDHNSCVSHL
jgi:hypothetical protein